MKVLIPLLLSVAVRTLTSELSDLINSIDGEIVHPSELPTLFLQQEHWNQNYDQEDNVQGVHSLQYWLEILGDDNDELEIVDIGKQQIQNTQFELQGISEIQMNNDDDLLKKQQENQSTEQQHSRLSKYVQLQQPELQEVKVQEQQPQNSVKKEEVNPLKLLLLYGDDANVNKNNKQNQEIIESNEQILQQLEKEKIEKIEKMQSLIIQELKDKKPEKKKESSFLEKDYIEWEMKTLTNNNRVR